jgi:succinate dehydrogenase / fumarate reductase cytochrome b subunit
MTWLLSLWRSSIGGKVTMAVTGVLLFLFVVAHLLGNLQLLSGPDAIDDYAKFLASKPALLWIARAVLLLLLLVHVATAIRLRGENRAARPVPYAATATLQATMASRSMVFTGLTTLAFVVYHLLHFTLGVTNPEHFALKAQRHGGHDVYAMVVASFSVPGIVVAYIAAQLLLFMHLMHGIQSFAQTLGLHHARYTPLIKKASVVLAGLVAGGNILLPLAVLRGMVVAQ